MKSEMNLWYIDDGTLGGSLTNLINDVQTIQTEGPLIGLTINSSKCEIITSDLNTLTSIRRLLPGAQHVNPENSIILKKEHQ